MEGVKLIKELIRQADNRIIIMPGSGLRACNIIELAEKTGAEEFHTSARMQVTGHMQFLNPAMGGEFQTVLADRGEIEAITELLKKHFANLINNSSPH